MGKDTILNLKALRNGQPRFQRQKHWGPIIGLFAVGFNMFAISQAGEYFCAMRKPEEHDFIILLYCGAPK